jgi:hypothetical protein
MLEIASAGSSEDLEVVCFSSARTDSVRYLFHCFISAREVEMRIEYKRDLNTVAFPCPGLRRGCCVRHRRGTRASSFKNRVTRSCYLSYIILKAMHATVPR